jgi:FMN phosphatase YigB (HAD superfamily)
MTKIQYILFDAANTLIHKPLLWERLQTVFEKFGYKISIEILKKMHKLNSENIDFPDKTSEEFYINFNSELLISLGISPNQKLLEEMFLACTYLPWEKFEDTKIIDSLMLPIGVLSNFNSTLLDHLDNNFGLIFKHVLISENYGLAKPEVSFYKSAINEIGINPSNILYVGDSIKLDMDPAEKIGINAILIDRDNIYPNYKKRISSLNQLINYI